MSIRWNEHGDPVWEDDAPSFIDEASALVAAERRLPENEWVNWKTHDLAQDNPLRDERDNVVERACLQCGAWYELEWANDHDFTLTMSVSLAQPCPCTNKMQRNMIRTYSLQH